MKNIFLSAGVPAASDQPYGQTADPMLIYSAVRSLCRLVFGHKHLIWGGQPAITPMMWAACENLGVNYAQAVRLYQSRYFPQEQYPEENKRFANVTYIDAAADLPSSLLSMRKRMFTDHVYEAGIFIGGKNGIEDEYDLFVQYQPNAKAIVLAATGGGALSIAQNHTGPDIAAQNMVDFFSYLANRIEIDLPTIPVVSDQPPP